MGLLLYAILYATNSRSMRVYAWWPFPDSTPNSRSRWPLQTTVAGVDRGNSSINTAEIRGLAVGQVVHGMLRNVEAGAGVVDGEDVDGPAVVGRRPAASAL